MKQKSGVKLTAMTLAATMLLTVVPSQELQAETDGGSDAPTYSSEDGYVNEMIANNYTKVSANYRTALYTGSEVVMKAAERATGDAQITSENRGYELADQVVDLHVGDIVTLNVDVPETAQYYLGFDYLSYDESVLPVGLAMTVDGDFPYYECRNLEFETTWVQNGEKSYDRYDNEIVTVPDKLIQWERKYLSDGSYRRSLPLTLELEAGSHEIQLKVNEGNFLLGALVLAPPEQIPAYTGSQKAEGQELIEIQGEDFTYRNDSSIHGIAEYDTSLSPYEIKDTVLNTIDSDSFVTAGQKVTYQFDVYRDGYYYIGMNYRQSDKNNFPVFLNVEIDGEIPNQQMVSYPMAYTTKYKTTTLEDADGEKLSVYLEKGTHTISFTISIDEIREILEGLDEIMSSINDLSLEITKVAGTNADKYRDLKLTRYIPDIEDQLYGYADRLYALQDTVKEYAGKRGNIAVLSSMSISAQQLISLAEEPDEIPYRVAELCTSASSANRLLSNTVDTLIKNKLAIDRIYIYQEDAVLPKKPNVFASAGMNIKRFVTSFTDQAYSTGNTDPEHLQVWVNRSSQYVQIMQKMIDEYFTLRRVLKWISPSCRISISWCWPTPPAKPRMWPRVSTTRSPMSWQSAERW